MSMFKNSTSPSKVGGNSMWFPQQRGDTAKMWKNFSGGKKEMGHMGKMKDSKAEEKKEY